jgi:subtilisin family serine protease
MNRRVPVFSLCAALALAACSPDVVAPIKAPLKAGLSVNSGNTGGRYIVLFKGAGSEKDFSAKVTQLGGSVSSYHAGAGIAVVSGMAASNAAQLAAAGFGDVQADFVFSPNDQTVSAQADASNVSDAVESQGNPAGAGRFNFQWNMRQIHAPAAWAAGKLGSPNVTVAIIDTGLDYDAPDLNGLVDLNRSHSFMNHFVFGREDDPTTPQDEYTPIVPSDDDIVGFFPGRNLVTDLNGHGTNVGTQVSSKAAALAGVTSRTTLIGVKVLGANGYGSFTDILNGVLWAADHGADVANMSLGGGFSKSANGQALAAINQAFNYAKQKGMVIVVAAGNSGIDLQHNGNQYSTYCDAPHVICVSSVGPALGTDIGTPAENGAAFYTNFGKNSVDVAGPGGNGKLTASGALTPSRWPWSAPAPAPFTGNDVASWVWSYCAKQTIVIQKSADGIHGDLFITACIAGNRLTGFIGTSQASPHVAGLAALLVAENGKGNPQRVKQIIEQSGVVIDKALGRSRIDVKNALGL